MPEYAEINKILNMPWVLKSGPQIQNFEYEKVLNLQGSEYASVTQRSEYAKICLDSVLNYTSVSKYARILTMAGF